MRSTYTMYVRLMINTKNKGDIIILIFLPLQIFLDYVLFLRKLAMEANVIAQRDRETVLTAAHINLVVKVRGIG